MTTLKTAIAKDGRVLPVLEKDYKRLYEQAQKRIEQLEARCRRLQGQVDTADKTGFGSATRSTSFKQKRRVENQKAQQRKAGKKEQSRGQNKGAGASTSGQAA
jgi:hypothetical protein